MDDVAEALEDWGGAEGPGRWERAQFKWARAVASELGRLRAELDELREAAGPAVRGGER